ncbi:hypothetical protein [Mesorhizobium sp. M4B.F.Ca.ET.017.02.2.1]|uniref:hypothetical protein n=1 Tax=Mesorhizobium sp. M4B.F.Ca.ET.017.02.2.1 TaxID=2496649 RepID=UPI000FCBCC2F|nr:hypothetical protein [Mesorhizobium sp. M4B.F.Ca.ET.017.02.2.1]RVD30186.1 hypothetical protein EN738_07300 [Mesorhizobium sp. M4B.F.Ca.ET.017.02.2.1]
MSGGSGGKFMAKPLEQKGMMRVSIEDNGKENAFCEMKTEEAGPIAALLLKTAKDANANYAPTGRSNYSVLVPSGINVAPGHKPGYHTLVFHFGDTTIGFAIPHQELQTFGQRLMTLGAEGLAQ